MSRVAATGRRVRAVVALVLAYAVALQALLPAYAQALTGPGLSGVICSVDHAQPGNGSHTSGKIHCAQCGWDSPGAALPDPPAAPARTSSDHATDRLTPSGVVSPCIGPRLSQGPPRPDC